MEIDKFLPTTFFCEVYKVDLAFINSLKEFGLIQIVVFEKQDYIEKERLKDIERMIRLHYDLDINMAGIEAISHLIDRINLLQQEVKTLKGQIRIEEF